MFETIRQEVALVESRVVGVFRYRDVFQLRPVPEQAPTLASVPGHHPCLLEFKYAVREVAETPLNPEVPRIQSMIDFDDSKKRRREVLLLLSTFCKSRVFQYETGGTATQQWFVSLPKGPGDTAGVGKLYWGVEGYGFEGCNRIIESFSESEEPPISKVDRNKYFSSDHPGQWIVGETSGTFEMPDNIQGLLDCYYDLPEEARKPYLSSCFLLCKGIELARSAPSLAFAACASAIETLSAFDHREEKSKKCPECHQDLYNVGKKFREFIETNGPSPGYEKFAKKIYKRRSEILHSGQLTFGEVEPWTTEKSIDALSDADFRRKVISFFRICLINWLAKTHTRKT
jgi:hypothetical protein